MSDEPHPPNLREASRRLKAEAGHSRELASRLADAEDHLADVEEQVAETFDEIAASPRGQVHHAQVADTAREQAAIARHTAEERRRLSHEQC